MTDFDVVGEVVGETFAAAEVVGMIVVELGHSEELIHCGEHTPHLKLDLLSQGIEGSYHHFDYQ